ncbi:fatty acid desaturase [Paenibacillus roseipurpureus]|uniref:Fatty acid desaturase n=1 Tax=Paenibacillus roseopurpureus TaxID=2918901 RepID=A0AA96RMP0_9BACL|nr:fatty acid desaturase [Paenibacillus sp. MBLB1832]WNR44497.1 fatty acid desaturase [Paenibacillus sp. MBLB1832]
MKHEDKGGWRSDIAPFERPHMKRSVWQIINTVGPFFVLWYLAFLSLSVSVWLTFIVDLLAAGFLIRIFIIFHDCCHKSFFRNKLANEIVGTLTGILTFVPYHQWRHTHSVHHASSGNLDRRGVGDIWTLTVDEYMGASKLKRIAYRLYRNPLVMFIVGPIFIFLVDYRFNRKRAGMQERMNTYITNVVIVGSIALLCWGIGWQSLLLIQGPIFFFSGMAGIWLFYVQHTYEDTYFEKAEEWDYVKAAMHGSSFYNLPRILHWITGDIGYHHIHHLSPRVPNYHLRKVHNKNAALRNVQTIGLVKSFESLKYRIWNEESKKFIQFKDLKQFRVKIKPHLMKAVDVE